MVLKDRVVKSGYAFNRMEFSGELAAHYRFGARTAGSNLMIGLVFVGLAIFL
jgi:hypothetical protein